MIKRPERERNCGPLGRRATIGVLAPRRPRPLFSACRSSCVRNVSAWDLGFGLAGLARSQEAVRALLNGCRCLGSDLYGSLLGLHFFDCFDAWGCRSET